jgi:hypothetical protein
LEKQSKLNSGSIQYLLLVHFKRLWIQDWQYFFLSVAGERKHELKIKKKTEKMQTIAQ